MRSRIGWSALVLIVLTAAAGEPNDSPAGNSGCLPSHNGYLRVRMRGASNLDIDWHDADMQCEGGARPEGRGIRVAFAGPAPDGVHRVRFVFGIAAPPGMQAGRDLAANVTVIFEGDQRLYSTAGDGKCTIDVYRDQALASTHGSRPRRISARGFCTEPAAPVGGGSGILLTRFDFAGLVEGLPQGG